MQRSENGDEDDQSQTTCCKISKCCTPCCNRFCLPCTRINNRCCCRSKGKPIVDAISNENEKQSIWKRIKWCGGKKDKLTTKTMSETTMERVSTVGIDGAAPMTGIESEVKRGKCRLCIDKFLCCRKTNKIDSRNDVEEMAKCCGCFPRRKQQQQKRGSMAWGGDSRRSSNLSDQEKKYYFFVIFSQILFSFT